jgi:hypothetical protein
MLTETAKIIHVSITTVLAVPVLVTLATSLGYNASRLRSPSRTGPSDRRPVPLRSLAWTALLAIAFTLILAERQAFASLWLQLLLLTFVPLGVGFVAGRFIKGDCQRSSRPLSTEGATRAR